MEVWIDRTTASGNGPAAPETAAALSVVEGGRVVAVRVEEALDLASVPAFLKRIQPLCRNRQRVILDLRPVDFVDSEGVRALLLLKRELDEARGELRLVLQPGSRVQRTLTLLRLERWFAIYPSVRDAWLLGTAAPDGG